MTQEQKLADLEQQVAGLKRNFVRVLRILDRVAKPNALDRSMIEGCATKIQEKALYDLMDQISDQIKRGQPVMSHDVFQHRVYDIFPLKDEDTPSGESFLIAAARDGRWREVYEHMQLHGLNLPSRFDDLETAS